MIGVNAWKVNRLGNQQRRSPQEKRSTTKSSESMKNCYIVYKTTNLINGKYYIGVHGTNDEITDPYIGNGITGNYTRSTKKGLHAAVRKYGYKNFKTEILYKYPYTEAGKIEAYKKEHEIVNRDFVKNPMTYNLCIGGKVPSSVHEKAVAQYDLDGHFIKVWSSMSEAKDYAPSQSISECCIRNTYSKNYQWRYYTGDTSDIGPAKIRAKVVYQFDLQGNYITYYKSVHDASRETGIPYQSIGGNCLNKQSSAGGYYWSYKKRFDFDPKKVRKTAVACYTDEGCFIKSFDSISDASREYRINAACIKACIQGKTKHSGKVRWRYFYGNSSNISPID